MALILCIETATKVCSVALAQSGSIIAVKESKTENFSHSENLNVFIESIFESTAFSLDNIDALAISMGPGSYTGLRIGVSTAKGLAYGLNVPVIGISSLKSLANLAEPISEDVLICPMFDARRMEVYTALFDTNLSSISKIEAKIIDEDSFSDLLENQKILFIGPGAEKCIDAIHSPNAIFELGVEVSSKGMASLAEEKYIANEFEDLAYFEPFYLKDFIAGKPKQLL